MSNSRKETKLADVKNYEFRYIYYLMIIQKKLRDKVIPKFTIKSQI